MRSLKLLLLVVIIFLVTLTLGSCMFWGLTDNSTISVISGFNDFSTKIFADGDFLYVSHPGNGYLQSEDLLIFDVSNPVSPVIAGTYQSGSGSIDNVSVSDDLAYIRTESTVETLNVSDSVNPIPLDSISLGPGELGLSRSNALFFDDNYIYCSGRASIDDDTLKLINVNNPLNITLGGELTFNTNIMNITVAGNTAYIGCTSGLVIVDVSTKAAPFERSHLNLELNDISGYEFPGMNMVIYDNTLFMVYKDGLLHIVDVSDLDNPVLIKIINNLGVNDIAIWDNLLYTGTSHLVAESTGIGVYDLTDPFSPKIIDRYRDIFIFLKQIKLTEQYIFALGEEDLMVVFR